MYVRVIVYVVAAIVWYHFSYTPRETRTPRRPAIRHCVSNYLSFVVAQVVMAYLLCRGKVSRGMFTLLAVNVMSHIQHNLVHSSRYGDLRTRLGLSIPFHATTRDQSLENLSFKRNKSKNIDRNIGELETK